MIITKFSGRFVCGQFGAQCFRLFIGIFVAAVFTLGDQLVMAGQQADGSADARNAVFSVVVGMGFRETCRNEQIKLVQNGGNIPVAGILIFKNHDSLSTTSFL